MLQIKKEYLRTMIDHAEKTYPEECCGIIAGNAQNVYPFAPTQSHQFSRISKVVTRIIPLSNIKEDSKTTRYMVPDRDHAEWMRKLSRQGLDILGFFHSHPNVLANPSQFDQEHAWTGYSYLIFSVQNGKVESIQGQEGYAGWVLEESAENFSREEINILE